MITMDIPTTILINRTSTGASVSFPMTSKFVAVADVKMLGVVAADLIVGLVFALAVAIVDIVAEILFIFAVGWKLVIAVAFGFVLCAFLVKMAKVAMDFVVIPDGVEATVAMSAECKETREF